MSCKNICIDLDRTFIKNDSTIVIFRQFIAKNGIRVLLHDFVLFRVNFLKEFIAERTELEYIDFCVDYDIVRYILELKSLGFQVHLVTGSNSIIANHFFKKFDFFDFLHCSSLNLKLKGRNKANYLKYYFKEEKFIYIGDSYKDIHVWRVSKSGFFPKRFLLKFIFLQKFLGIEPI